MQPAQDVREMAAEHAAIRVQLVDDDELQVLEELRPARMVRQDARVHHVGVAQHDVRAPADRAARILRRVTVVGEGPDVAAALLPDERGQLVELGQLVLRECLGWKHVERTRRGVGENLVQHRRVVTERLAGRRGGDDDHIAAGESVPHGRGLVCVELVDPARAKRAVQAFVESVRERRELGGHRRQPPHRRHVRVVVTGPGRRQMRGLEPREHCRERLVLVAGQRRQRRRSHEARIGTATSQGDQEAKRRVVGRSLRFARGRTSPRCRSGLRGR